MKILRTNTNKFISYFWILVSCSYAHVSLSGGPSVPHPAAPAALRQVLLGPWPLVAWSKGWAFNDPIAPMLLKSGFRTFRMFHFGHSLTLGGSMWQQSQFKIIGKPDKGNLMPQKVSIRCQGQRLYAAIHACFHDSILECNLHTPRSQNVKQTSCNHTGHHCIIPGVHRWGYAVAKPPENGIPINFYPLNLQLV